MTINEAKDMIRLPVAAGALPAGNWADLGCGAGIFTCALADLLAPGSVITAVDREAGVLKKLPAGRNGVTILPVAAEITGFIQTAQPLNGVLMANALHFIPAQRPFLLSLRKSLVPGGLVILIEYDMTRPSRWVPYPLPPAAAADLFAACGFTGFTPLQRRASLYGPQFLYSAVIHG